MRRVFILRCLLIFVSMFVLNSCYTTEYYTKSLESEYNQSYCNCTKTYIINQFGTPNRVVSIGNGQETLVYERYSSFTYGMGNASVYGTNTYAYGFSNTSNNRRYVEFYIDKNSRCYQVKTNERKSYAVKEKNKNLWWEILVGVGSAGLLFALLMLSPNSK